MKELLERIKASGHSPDAQAQNLAEFASMVLADPEIAARLDQIQSGAEAEPAGDSPADA